MADSRRCILAFVALTLLLGLVPAANAQNAAFQCVANAAVPPTFREDEQIDVTGTEYHQKTCNALNRVSWQNVMSAVNS